MASCAGRFKSRPNPRGSSTDGGRLAPARRRGSRSTVADAIEQLGGSGESRQALYSACRGAEAGRRASAAGGPFGRTTLRTGSPALRALDGVRGPPTRPRFEPTSRRRSGAITSQFPRQSPDSLGELRLRISFRSNSASAAKMPNTRRPAAVVVSICAPLAGEHPQAHAAGGQCTVLTPDGRGCGPGAVELPDDEHVALPQGAQAAVESRPVVADAGGEVVVGVGFRRTLAGCATFRAQTPKRRISPPPANNPTKGSTPVLSPAEASKLLDCIDTGSLAGLRDRALMSVMLYSFARVSAVLGMRRQDYFQQGSRGWLRFHEKGGKRHDVPAHHRAAEALDEYLEACMLEEPREALFQSVDRAGERLTGRPLSRRVVLAMIKRRAAAAGLPPSTCCHTFWATGIAQGPAHPLLFEESPIFYVHDGKGLLAITLCRSSRPSRALVPSATAC